MLMSVQGRKSRYVTKLSSPLKFMCSRSPAPALLWVCLVFTLPEEAGWAGLVSCQRGEAILAIGDGVTVCADTGTLHTVQCSVSGQETG